MNTQENEDLKKMALLSFSLGPVQQFIATAQSVRDLWTGSYLLSWLTFHAMKPVIDAQDTEVFVFPELKSNPLKRWYVDKDFGVSSDQLLAPCLPNLFLALVPKEGVEVLAKKCEEACREKWRDLSTEVQQHLDGMVKGKNLPQSADWDRLWQQQTETFFEVRTNYLDWTEVDDDSWQSRWQLIGGLLDAQKMIRHYPAYHPEGDMPQKCSLLGTLEQMGPANLAECKAFWKEFSEKISTGGTRTRSTERLCAISLIKRFAWAIYFSRGEYDKKFSGDTKKLRYEDTATVAAKFWLEKEPMISPEKIRKEKKDWSGQWLHWNKPNQDSDEWPVPDDLWNTITTKRKREKPPTYYVILMMDGDKMGDKLRKAERLQHKQISGKLAEFALNIAPSIVTKHGGELIYAGGDDVLALLPTKTAVACAKELSNEFAKNWGDLLETNATVSAGIAIVHYKEDLRFALQQARDAEKSAKNRGRDALVIRACRRSGEHASALCPWNYAETFQDFVNKFLPVDGKAGASDRWAYHLAAVLPTLQELSQDAMQAEILRLIKRAEKSTQEKLGGYEHVVAAFSDYVNKMPDPKEDDYGKKPPQLQVALRDWVTLMQTASFLARGRED